MKTNKTPLRGKYLIQNPKALKWIQRIDAFLEFYVRKIKRAQGTAAFEQGNTSPCNPINFKKILICDIGHLGDVIAATGILETIKKNCPDCKIGILVSSGSKCVVEDHPLIDKIHVFDHWKVNRQEGSFFQKILRHIFSSKRARKELRSEGYDCAIDLYYFFPNAIPLLYRAHVPIRIGYTSGGFGPLLTHQLDWELKDRYIGFYHLELLKLAGMNIHDPKLKPVLPGVDAEGELKRKISNKAWERGYVVFHIGSGHELKEWTDAKWAMLTKKVLKKYRNITVIFTGLGKIENDKIEKVMSKTANALNLCDKLSWHELVLLVKHAQIIVSVDTAVAHLAAAWGKNALVLYSGINNFHHWRFPSGNILALMRSVSCSFCYNNKGCEKMTCIKDISVDSVFDSAVTILEYEKELVRT